MKFYATPLSHFSRKVRILLDLYSMPYQFVDVGNVAEGSMETFAENPLMRVPVLVDGDQWIIESDHIASYVVQKVDPADRYQVRTSSIHDLNIRAVLNGIMSDEVTLILSRRTGIPTEKFVYYGRALESIVNGLEWLEKRASSFNADEPKYRDFHLVCALEHLTYYNVVPMNYPKLRKIVDKISSDEAIRKTAPYVVKPK